MPIYEYECDHATLDEFYPMGEAPQDYPMPDACIGKRVYSFHHMEDRRHTRKGISATTGQPYATSRFQERQIEKEKGIEFLGPSEMPAEWIKARDYARYLKSGGTPIAPDVLNPPPKISFKGTILKKMSERGLRFGA